MAHQLVAQSVLRWAPRWSALPTLVTLSVRQMERQTAMRSEWLKATRSVRP